MRRWTACRRSPGSTAEEGEGKSKPFSPSGAPKRRTKPPVNELARALLDASATLALIHDEPGADAVRDALRNGAAMSAVNVAEVAARLHQQGWLAEEVAAGVRALRIEVLPFDAGTALRSGALRPVTAPFGLGLGDRSCLATAAALGVPALTADRAWRELRIPGVEVRCIR